MSLPFLLSALLLAGIRETSGMEDKKVLQFRTIQSTCIDLAHYDPKTKELTVRFVSRNPEKFYIYKNVSEETWANLEALNRTGGVGEFFNQNIVRQPKRYPYQTTLIKQFEVIGKEKAGDSK